MFFLKKVLLGIGVCLLAACAATPAKGPANADDEERVAITGSSIARKPKDAAKSGVKTVSVEDIAQSRNSAVSLSGTAGGGQ